MPAKSQHNGKATRSRRTRAQIQADLIASGLPVSKPSAAAVKRSRLAAEARARGQPVAPSGSAKATKDSPPLDHIDYQTVIAYISKPHICNAVFGAGSQTRVTGLPMGPQSLLNPLAIEINNNYNIRHNITNMCFNGRVLYMRLKRYKAKYMQAHIFSIRTGSGLSAKNRADGINTMEDLLESMCPCYKDMDALFRDRGNVTAFGILDSGVGPQGDEFDDSEDGIASYVQDESDGDTTDGHDLTIPLPVSATHPTNQDGPSSSEPDENKDLNSPRLPATIPEGPSFNALNNHYRDFLDDRFSLPPPTPGDPNKDEPVHKDEPVTPTPEDPTKEEQPVNPVASRLPTPARVSTSDRQARLKYKKKTVARVPLTAEERALDDSDKDGPTKDAQGNPVSRCIPLPSQVPTSDRQAYKKKKFVAKVPLTAEEHALDDSDDDALTTTATQLSQSGTKRGAPRSNLSLCGLEPLPSIDPSHVHIKEHKHALASAIQQVNEAKLEIIAKGNELYQQIESNRIKAELDARTSDLSWAKEKYFLDRQDQCDSEARRLSQEAQKERQAFCKRLVKE